MTAWPGAWRAIEATVMAAATPCALASPWHGPRHWRAVARVGLELCRLTPEADAELVALFALIHDSRRLNDYRDPGHGPRAAELVDGLRDVLGLDDARLAVLALACRDHDAGGTSTDPTVGACWDADRLNLWRTGQVPDPRRLSTAAAREAELYTWSRGVHVDPPSWERLAAMVGQRPARLLA